MHIFLLFNNYKIYLYYLWLIIYGCGTSFSITIINSLFTDLTTTGKRDFIFSFKWFITMISSSLGPFIVILMFYYLGNNWKIYEMNIVILTGLGMYIIPTICLIFGFDKKELDLLQSKNHNKDTKRVKEVIAFVKVNGGLEYAVSKMKAFQTEALQLLETYPDSEYKSSLKLMVNYVIERKR